MANVRKVPRKGGKFAWQATVTTIEGKRKSKDFAKKSEADAWIKANDKVGASGSANMTLGQLAKHHNAWFEGLVKAGERAQVTLDGYQGHLDNHLLADDQGIAQKPLSEVDTPLLQGFCDRLLIRTGSAETTRKVKTSLSAWCGHGARNGWLKGEPLKSVRIVERRKRRTSGSVVIPEKETLTAVLQAAAEGDHAIRDTAMVHLLMFGGLRISEALGAPDECLELRRPGPNGGGGLIEVRERLCSKHVTLNEVKSDEGMRTIPLGPAAAAALRAWRVARGPSPAIEVGGRKVPGRLFPAPPGLRYGGLFSYQDWRRKCWWGIMQRAGLGETMRDGKRIPRPHVDFGPHTLRHVYASIQIENGVTPKRLQKLMGHATLAMTMDLYGHLWTDDAADQALAAAAERAIPVPKKA